MAGKDTAITLEVASEHGTREVRVSNPDRVLWPAHEGRPAITKEALARYFVAVGDPLRRALADRPVTLQRFPEGVEGEEFYSKNPPKGVPEWVRTVTVRYPSGRRHAQLVVDEVATAVWAAQMGTVTFHPWPVRTGDTDNPDELRIDLDPQPGRDFCDAVSAAHALRDLMAEVGLTAWVKTSGNRGVHVFAPIVPDHEFLQVRHAVIGIARELERRLPDLVTTAWWKEERGERVFVDYNQANRDRTMASAWSPRPLPGAPISVPVDWDELDSLDPRTLTIHTVTERLHAAGDPWQDLHSEPAGLAGALALWQADLERGLGELSFPPDYPKMPGEPPRVPPSKRRADKADADYLAPKAERDADERAAWNLPVTPPVLPMLATSAKEIPAGDFGYEPKWDGFRAIVFRSGDRVEIGSRNTKPLTRYFPELVDAFLAQLPERCVLDGEIVVVDPTRPRLDFDLLSQRIHPAASRIRRLAQETPAAFVAFDLLALGDEDLTGRPFAERRAALERALAGARAPLHLTPMTRDRDEVLTWFEQFEGAGLDGVVAKATDTAYVQDKRVMVKIKHERTADVVLAGYRTHKTDPEAIGSLLLGLYAADGTLRSVGVVGALPMARRRELFAELQPLVADWDDHPWSWAREEETRTPRAAGGSRWAAGKDLSFTPLTPTRVLEVRYDHLEGERFRHTAQFVRWRPDRDPESCTYDQLDEPVTYDLEAVLRGESG